MNIHESWLDKAQENDERKINAATDDVSYCQAISIYGENGEYVSDSVAAHRPCPDMEGVASFHPKNAEKGQAYIEEIRKTLKLKRQSKREPIPHSYVCNETNCLGPTVGQRSARPKEVIDDRWRERVRAKALRLPNRLITPERYDTTKH